jgi:hypothetical protein
VWSVRGAISAAAATKLPESFQASVSGANKTKGKLMLIASSAFGDVMPWLR